ncbi:MAG: hypothetical protein QM687_04775 [Ferruginibacter sp.]
MKRILLPLLICTAMAAKAQGPCTINPVYRQFDFWIGEWEAYGPKGNKAGDSKMSFILDSCIVLEEWTSAGKSRGITYAGKSFNTYNAQTGQWQQTWVDNVGGTTAYTKGKFHNNVMLFETEPLVISKDSVVIKKMSFFSLEKDKVRQLAEISGDNGKSWRVQVDLEYRRKKL